MAEELYEFYGEECPHCKAMEPRVEKLEKELGVTIKKLEVWHNEENDKLMRKLDKEGCMAVPLFVNTKSGKSICGEVSYEELKAWAQGK